MTIDEAIKVLEEFRIPDPGEDFEKEDKAIGLGIEALGKFQLKRKAHTYGWMALLPGETEE